MEFERLINSSGPTNGQGAAEKWAAARRVWPFCTASAVAMNNYNEYCSRACCMYSLKISQLVHDYVGAEVHEIYRDMRILRQRLRRVL